jgi:hypothetical protein
MQRSNHMADEVIENAHKMEEARKVRAFVKEKFYPALLDNGENIDDTKFFLGSLSNLIMTEFLRNMNEKKFSDLHLEDKLDPQSPLYEKYKAVLDLFTDETIFNTKELIDGMRGEIQMLVDNEMKGRSLSTLNPNFLE